MTRWLPVLTLPDGLAVEIAAPRRTDADAHSPRSYRVTRYGASLGTFAKINEIADFLDRLTHDTVWRWEPPSGSLPALKTSLESLEQPGDAASAN